MTNLEIIKKAVHEAVPEIMELKFGCEVMIGKYRYVAHGSYMLEGHKTIRISQIPETMNWAEIYDTQTDLEILGRPIQLADVLRAIAVAHPNRHIVVNSIGGFSEYKFSNGEMGLWVIDGVGKEWDLSKPLDGQSEETLKFLADILK